MCSLDAAKYLPKNEVIKIHSIPVSAQKYGEPQRALKLITLDKLKLPTFLGPIRSLDHREKKQFDT